MAWMVVVVVVVRIEVVVVVVTKLVVVLRGNDGRHLCMHALASNSWWRV